MTRRGPSFANAVFSARFDKSYKELPQINRGPCDDAIVRLMKGEDSAGLRVKPIQPDKYYQEARVNSGDRIIFRRDSGTIYFVDIVSHDDISKYSRRPRGP